MFLCYLNAVWDWTDNAICTNRDPHPFCDSCLVKKLLENVRLKFQISRWPSGFMWFCLLYVEVLFCCMRRSAVSSACSEPGWEHWREGTAPTRRLYPEWRISTFFQNIVCALKSHPFLFLSPKILFLKTCQIPFSWIYITPNLFFCISVHTNEVSDAANGQLIFCIKYWCSLSKCK